MEFLGILKIMNEVVGSKQADRTLDSQAKEASSALCCKANTDQEIKSDSEGVNDANPNIPDYFRSSTDRVADKSTSHVLMQRIHNEFNDVFFRNWVFGRHV